jgi:hypothetical protein
LRRAGFPIGLWLFVLLLRALFHLFASLGSTPLVNAMPLRASFQGDIG